MAIKEKARGKGEARKAGNGRPAAGVGADSKTAAARAKNGDRGAAGQGGDGKRKTAGKAGKKEKKEKDPFADTSPMGLLKKEAAEKLGLVDKVRAHGWGGLTAAESGRIGALVNRMIKERTEGGEE